MANDRDILRRLAGRWMEIAGLPIMAERKRQWTALHDLKQERPMVLFETWTLENYVAQDELECEDPGLRWVELTMRWNIRQFAEVGDDIVLEPVWRLGYHAGGTGWGVDVPSEHATDIEGGSIGYRFDHPIKTPEDLDRLQTRTFSVDREATARSVEQHEDLFGDILPVVLHGTTAHGPALTFEAFRLLGNANLLTWPYDQPEALHRLKAFLRDDRVAWFDFLEREGLLGLNNNWTFVGSGSPGFTTALPAADYAGKARLKDVWVGVESQETTSISPDQFAEFFLPYMADVCRPFGLAYYGCCEPVHDRWHHIIRAIPQVRGVSVSPWCDMPKVAAMLGKDVVFSRKPAPGAMSGAVADWAALERDVDETWAAAKECNVEFVYRDVYRIGGERERLAKWVAMVRRKVGA